MMSYIYIFVGGGLGSLCRYGLSVYNQDVSNIPWGTLMANVIACLILGGLVKYQLTTNHMSFYLLGATGFCGGFSTFSTFSFELMSAIQQDLYLQAMVYIVLSLLLGVLAVWVGFKAVEIFVV